jgi:tetratricopeptide (TPR) repeat protein
MRFRLTALLVVAATVATLAGCGSLAAQHQADAAFRKALTAQLASQDDYAEGLYETILDLGFRWSTVYNNLAVIAVHRHEYRLARRLLAQAVDADDRDVVALTNYGVMSFYLSDFREARRTLLDAQALRRRNLDRIPTFGHDEWQYLRYERATEPLVATAQKYLGRIDRAELGQDLPVERELMAALTTNSL